MATDFKVYITDEACTRARVAATSRTNGWTLIPSRWGISDTNIEVVDQTRTSDSVQPMWVTQPYSAVTKYNKKSLLHSIVIPPDTKINDDRKQIREIYFFYKDIYNEEFLFAIAEPVDPLFWYPGVAQSFKFLFSLNNVVDNEPITNIVNIDYTYPQDIEDHNVNVDAHDYLLARNGSRTATGVLRYDDAYTIENDTDIIYKGYLDSRIWQFEDYIDQSIPVGAMMWWPTNRPPEFWMVRNGASLPIDGYSELYAVIGNKYGGDDVLKTFNLPYDYFNYIRGSNGGLDVGKQFKSTTEPVSGTEKDEPYQNNTNTINTRLYLPIIKVRSNNIVRLGDPVGGEDIDIDIYTPGEILEEWKATVTQSDSSQIQVLQSGIYELVVIGGGGTGTWVESSIDPNATCKFSAGASGALFVAEIYLPAGTYRGQAGKVGSESYFANVTTQLLTAGAGGNTTAKIKGAAGTITRDSSLTVTSNEQKKFEYDGNAGSYGKYRQVAGVAVVITTPTSYKSKVEDLTNNEAWMNYWDTSLTESITDHFGEGSWKNISGHKAKPGYARLTYLRRNF